MATIDSKIPEGALAEKWTNYKAHQKLVNPANKRRLDIIVVGTGLAGASAAASLGALGFKVLNFCIQDSPRRAHSIAAQGGINAAKNYQNDGDSVYRLFYDTIKGGDYRAREANVYLNCSWDVPCRISMWKNGLLIWHSILVFAIKKTISGYFLYMMGRLINCFIVIPQI